MFGGAAGELASARSGQPGVQHRAIGAPDVCCFRLRSSETRFSMIHVGRQKEVVFAEFECPAGAVLVFGFLLPHLRIHARIGLVLKRPYEQKARMLRFGVHGMVSSGQKTSYLSTLHACAHVQRDSACAD